MTRSWDDGATIRLTLALAATVATAVMVTLISRVGTARTIEDACTTEPPPGWLPELTVVRGPVRDGLVTLRCEAIGGAADPFVFTDPVPLLGTIVVGMAGTALIVLAWRWALRSRTPR